eukprot:6186699-Pleurochrysis_carterae.AAC.1
MAKPRKAPRTLRAFADFARLDSNTLHLWRPEGRGGGGGLRLVAREVRGEREAWRALARGVFGSCDSNVGACGGASAYRLTYSLA